MTKARAIAPRWRMPPESWCGKCRRNLVRPTRRIAASTRRRALGARERRASSGRSRHCSSTDIQGKSPLSWNTIAFSTVQPAAVDVDACRRSAVSRPARMRSRVDLPQPDGPTMQTNSPGAIARSMPSSATTLAGPLEYSLRRFAIVTAAPRLSATIIQRSSPSLTRAPLPTLTGAHPASCRREEDLWVGGAWQWDAVPDVAALIRATELVGNQATARVGPAHRRRARRTPRIESGDGSYAQRRSPFRSL